MNKQKYLVNQRSPIRDYTAKMWLPHRKQRKVIVWSKCRSSSVKKCSNICRCFTDWKYLYLWTCWKKWSWKDYPFEYTFELWQKLYGSNFYRWRKNEQGWLSWYAGCLCNGSTNFFHPWYSEKFIGMRYYQIDIGMW